jgi:hypothetical protein
VSGEPGERFAHWFAVVVIAIVGGGTFAVFCWLVYTAWVQQRGGH